MVSANVFFFTYFLELANQDPPPSVPLGLYVELSLHTIPYEDLMSFFLDLADHTLLYLNLWPDYVSSPAWT